VLVPYRADGGPRDAAWVYMRRWWAINHPDWQLVEGGCPDGPWRKAVAVADALARADGDLLVVADADVWCPDLSPALASLERGLGRWAIPHQRVYRLTEYATAAVLAGGQLPDPPLPRRTHPAVAESYTGVVGGGLVVLPADMYRQVPLDPRFAGFGQEDQSWARALDVIAGPPWRGRQPLWHLWHPPQPRISRAIGSVENLALYRRYRAASTTPAMLALLAEVDATS
jgi:hypothetical protein